jgi:hypothetical protein
MRPSLRSSRDRRRGHALFGVLIVLLLVAVALGGNYVRNYQTDAEKEKKPRPYAKYALDDLKMLADGYRMELAAAEKRHGGQRVGTRSRHHFGDQVQEFERVQRETRKVRDKALAVVGTRANLKEVETEITRRESMASGAQIHIERMFRL